MVRKTSIEVINPIEALAEHLRDTSQAALARRMGVTAAYLSYVMSGARTPGARILAFLGLDEVRVYQVKGGTEDALKTAGTHGAGVHTRLPPAGSGATDPGDESPAADGS